MKLTPIGYWAVPAAGETTCFVLETAQATFLLDTGMNPAFGLTAAGCRLVDVSHVFLSHCHADHLSGFAGFVFGRTVQERSTGPAPRLCVIGSESTVDAGRTLLAVMYPDRQFDIDWIVLTPETPVQIGSLAAQFMWTTHTVPGLALRLIENGRVRFAFTSDTSLSDELVQFCEGADLLLGECFGTEADFGPVMKAQRHLSAKTVGSLAANAKVSRLVLFHMHLPYRNEEKRADLLTDVSATFGGEVVFPSVSAAIDF